MSNIVSKIQVPSGTTYDIKPTNNANVNVDGIFYISSDNGSTTSAIISNLTSLTSYYEGLKLVLHYTLNAASSTSVTLQINNLSPVSIKRDSNVLESGLRKGGMYFLCYDGTNFCISNYHNSTSTVNYDNPVAGNSTNTPVAAMDINAGDFVYYDKTLKGLVPLSYNLTAEKPIIMDIFYDWGLAVSTSSYRQGGSVNSKHLLQQITIPLTNVITPSATNVDCLEIYAFFDADGQIVLSNSVTIQGTSNILLNDGAIGHSSADSNVSQFIYIGLLDRTNNCIYVDLSNHNFIKLFRTITNTSPIDIFNTVARINGIIAINGYSVLGSGNSNANHDNPVSGIGDNPVAACDISAGQFVYCENNTNNIRSITDYLTDSTGKPGINYDWGLAYCTADISSGSIIPETTLLQQTTIDLPGNQTVSTPVNVYAFFGYKGPSAADTSILYVDTSAVGAYTLAQDAIGFIYVGLAENDKLHIDLSNHDFVQVDPVNVLSDPPFTKGSIVGINGRNIYVPPYQDLLFGNVYGICDDFDWGGVDPRSGEQTDSGGTGPWTALATTTQYYEPRERSIVALYITVDFYGGAYLNINNQGAYPVYYNNAPISRNDITASCTAVFMFDGIKYNLIAGGTPTDSSIDVNLFERVNRKVTSLSSNSTNTQYPSAKCVYDLIGDVETLLSEI